MNILIAGANGLLGRNLINKLSQSNKIYALVRSTSSVKFKINENIQVIGLDLSRFELTMLPKHVDAIFYLAQSNKFKEFPNSAGDIMNINVYAPFKLINWAIKNDVKKFIYASSGGVYALAQQLFPLTENLKICINKKSEFYISSKLSAEILLKNFSGFFETFAIIRPFFIYGKYQNPSMLIPRLIYNIKNNKEIFINKNGGIKLNPIYVEDAAMATAKILDLKGEYIFNIAGNEVVSIKELCYIIGSILNVEPIFKIVKNKQNDLVADNKLMQKLLAVPTTSLYEGLRKII